MKLNSTVRSLVLFILSLTSIQAVAQTAIPTGSFGNACLVTGTVSWDNSVMSGSDRVIVFAKAGSAITVGTPTNSYATYTASSDFSSPVAPAYQNDAAAVCVYKGTGASQNLTGLTAGTTYHFLIFNTDAGTTFSAALTFSGPTLTAPGDVSGLSAGTGNGQSSVSWTNPSTCFDEVMIVASTATVSGAPSGNGSAYTDNLAFGSGTAFGGGFVVYKGSTSPKTVTGLTNGLTYFFKVWSRKTSTWSAGLETSVTLPPSPVTGGSFTASCTDAGAVAWTNPGAVYRIVVFAKATSAVTVGVPSLDVTSAYTASTTFGAGTQYQHDPAAFCVYNGTGNNVNITGLTANTTYHFLVFNANTTNYSTAATFNNPTQTAPPLVTGVNDTPGNGQFDASWSNPGSCFDEIMVVVKETSAVTAVPTGDGTAYTASTVFGSGTAIVAGEYVVFKGTGTSVTVTNVTNCVVAHYKVFTRKGTAWSAGVADTETPSAPPATTSLFPADGSTQAATNSSLVLTFNQPVSISGTGGSAAETSIVITENGSPFQTITRASGSISIVSNVVTVDINDLNLSDVSLKTYDVVVGSKVFAGCTTDFGGITSTNYQFSSSTGVSVTAPTAGVCENVFTPIGDIVLTETAVNNFQGTPSSGLTLVLRFDVPGFSFKSGTSGVTVVVAGGGDVTTVGTTSVSFSSSTFTINFPAGNVIDNADVLTIQGLQVTSDGTSPTGHIVRDASSTLAMQGINVSDNLATINTGAEPPAPTLTGFSTGVGNYCQGTNISAITVTVTGSGIKWYSDIGLNTIVYTGNPALIQSNLGINPATPGTTVLYAASTSGCTGPGLAVPITIYPSPGADAGTFGATQCSGNLITLGASPTISTPSTPPYGYSWTELTGNYTGPAISAVSNPTVTINNVSGSTLNYQFRVTITDANSCTAQSVNNFDVFTQATPNLTQPGTTTFTTETPPQTLAANATFTTTSFTGVGVIQTSATTYKFDPTQAYDDTQPLPQNFPIFFNGADPSGCPIVNYPIATMTLSNTTFNSLAPEYCGAEFPVSTPVGNAIDLTVSGTTLTNINNYVTNWNTTYRFYYVPSWNSGIGYVPNELVVYGGEIYRATLASVNVIPSINPAYWTPGAFQINFTNKIIRNYYEGYNGGNNGASTIRAKGATSYEMLTNIDYLNCISNCSNAYPAAYTIFNNYHDMRYYVGDYQPTYYYYVGDIVYGSSSFGGAGNIYKCIANNSFGSAPPPNPFYWQNVTGTGFDAGWGFYDAATSRAGFYTYGQFVTVNKNPIVSFAGLVNGQDICEADITGTTIDYDLLSNLQTGGVSNAGRFEISYDGSAWVRDGVTGVENVGINSGIGIFHSLDAWTAISTLVSGGSYAWAGGTTYDIGDNVFFSGGFYTSLTNGNLGHLPSSSPAFWRANTLSVDVRLWFDPGTTGSTPAPPPGTPGDVCAGISQIKVYLHQTPAIAFSGLSPDTFCNSEPAVNLTTVQTSGVVLSGFGVTNNPLNNGTGTFTPATAFGQSVAAGGTATNPQTIVLSATITDAFGCQNIAQSTTDFVVNPPPPSSYTLVSSIIPIKNITTSTLPTIVDFCFNDPTADIDGSQGTAWFDLYFGGTNIFNTGSLGSPGPLGPHWQFDPDFFYNDAVTNYGANPQNTLQFQLVYTAYDGNSCQTSISSVTLSVAPALQVDIGGITDDQVFCANEGSLLLQFTPFDAAYATFTVNTVSQPINPTGDYLYTLSNSALGDITFAYNIASGSGNQCQNPKTKTIHVMPAPVADFPFPPQCDGTNIPFNGSDISVHPVFPHTASPTFTWDFADNPPVQVVSQNTNYTFTTIGNYPVTLDIAYDPDPVYGKVCRANNPETSRIQVVGPIPTVDFTFSNICEGDATNFVSSQTNGVTTYDWDFGDGNTTGFGASLSPIVAVPATSGTYQNPIHTFVPGTYSVTVTGMTAPASGGCTNFMTRVVSSLPKVTIDPTNFYDMAAGNGGWVMEDKAGFSLWNFSPATPLSGATQDAWNNIPYNTLDESYVNSPCFDMSAYTKPAISLQYFMDVRQQQDGAVLQYSTTIVAGVQQWVTLGSIGSGLNWYNTQGVSGKPGDPFNSTFLGWSRVADPDWLESKHSLDVIAGLTLPERQKVRFRIAFGSDGGSTNAAKGFAFNHVSIVERNRLSLIENFTNTNAPGAAANNTIFQNFLPGNPEIVKLQYHVGLPSPDPINMQNQDDPNARAAFYGITNSSSLVPRGYLDGTSQGNFTSGWLPNEFTLRSLKASPMTISINSTPTTIVATANPTLTITSGNLRFFVAAIEKTVGSDQFVVRKLYPNAAGMPIALPFGTANPATLTIDPWTFDTQQINDNTQMGVVAFVQDIDTQEVLQATYLDTPDDPAVITGLEPLGSSLVRAYPNPSDKEFTIELPAPVGKAVPLSLVNQLGQSVVMKSMEGGETRKSVSTDHLAEGVYILNLGDNGSIARKKIVVVHK